MTFYDPIYIDYQLATLCFAKTSTIDKSAWYNTKKKISQNNFSFLPIFSTEYLRKSINLDDTSSF